MLSQRLTNSDTITPPENKTLQLHWPFGRTVFLAALLLLLLVVISEGLSRLLVKLEVLQPPPIGSHNAELDVKLSLLDRRIETHGRIDCIFLGSSQTDSAIDPETFSVAFQENSGKTIHCFNFSLATLTAEPAGKIAAILAQRYHPALLIYGTSARDYSLDFGEWARPLLNDPWVRYMSEDFNLRGWLIEHSYTVRYLVLIRQQTNPDYRVFTQELRSGLTAFGYKPAAGNDLENRKTDFIPEYSISQRDLVGLDQFLRLQSQDLQILVVETPVHHSFLPYYVEADAEAYETKFITPIADFIEQYHVQFWRSQNAINEIVPDSGWSDTRHLNTEGGIIFSQWLGQKMVAEIASRKFEVPFQSENP
jgi:hypothetical protein